MKAYMLIGSPGCGKSTWVSDHIYKNYYGKLHPYAVMNIDSLRERYQSIIRDIVDPGFVYDRGNKDVEKFIKDVLAVEIVISSIKQDRDIFLDNMNLSAERRISDISRMKEIGKKFDVDIEFVAVYFDIDPKICWERICLNRNYNDINKIPEEIFWKNIDKMEPPTDKEGYSEIIIVKFEKPITVDDGKLFHRIKLNGKTKEELMFDLFATTKDLLNKLGR